MLSRSHPHVGSRSVLFPPLRARASRRTARNGRTERSTSYVTQLDPRHSLSRVCRYEFCCMSALSSRRRFSPDSSPLPVYFEVIRVDGGYSEGKEGCGPVRTTRRDSRPGAFLLLQFHACTRALLTLAFSLDFFPFDNCCPT